MALRPRALSLENLESRLNLSSLGGLRVPNISHSSMTEAQETALLARYKIISLDAYLKNTTNLSAAKNTGTSTGVINAPTNLAATAISNAMSLRWTDTATNEWGFRIYRSTDGVNFTQINTVGRNKTSYSDTTAATGVTYYYAVAAYNSSSQSALSNVSMGAHPVPVTAPLAPDAFSATSTGSDTVALAWSDNATNETGYHLYRSTDGTNYTLIGNLAANTSGFNDTGLSAGTQYYYTVAAWNSAGETFAAGAVTASTNAPAIVTTVPATPTGLSIVNVSTTGLTLSWADAAFNESGYRVYRSTDGTHYTLVGDLAADATSFDDSGLNAGTTYSYTVGAWNSAGESVSSAVQETTQALPALAPAPATNLSFTGVTATGLTINWTDNASDESGYRVYRSSDGVNFSNIADLPADSTGFADSGLVASTQYYYKIADWNSGGETSSTVVSAITQTPAPTVPSLTTFTNVSTNTITINWSDNASNETGYRVYRSTNGVTFTKIADLAANTTSFGDTGLSASTTYYYKVSAWNIGGSRISTAASQSTQAPVIQAPSAGSLSFASVTTSTLTINWADNASNESGYRVYRSTDGTNFTKIGDLPAGATSFGDAGLSSSVTYYYKVGAWNSGGETLSSAASQSTQAPVVQAPSAPSSLSFATVTTSTLTINWSDNASNETGYRVYRSTDGTNYTKIADLTAGASSFGDAGLSASTTYYYKVSAWNTGGETLSTAASQSTQAPVIQAPSAPSSLSFASVTTSTLTINWSDNASNETGYRVYRSTDGTNYTKVADLPAGALSFGDAGLSSSVTYYYKVGAWNSGGETLSNAASQTTQAPAVQAPSAPSSLSFASVTTSTLTINWTDNASNETGYRVYRSTNGVNFTKIADLAANTTTFGDTGLSASTTYYYKVSTWNTGGETLSSAASQSTQAPVVQAPSAPSSLSFASVTTSTLTINWADNSSNETGYRVYRSTDGTNFTKIGDLPAGATSFGDAGLSSSVTYYYKVGAWNSGGETLSSTASQATQAPVVQAPSAPSSLSFANVTSSSITLNWTDNSSNETGYRVYRSTDGTNFTKIADLAAGATTYGNSGLTANTTYYYKVSAWNSVGETLSSAASQATQTSVANPVSITTQSMTSFTELLIIGTSSNDSILVTQSNGVLTITANGQTTTLTNTFGDLVIHSGNGNDTITVDATVNIPALVYADTGGDVIRNLTTGKPTIVTIGAGSNSTVTGNGINTAYWVNTGDTVNSTTAETNLGGLNRVASFYQPWSTSPSNVDYIPLTLNGQNLRDPSDSGTVKRLTANSFWGTGATMNDINQTSLADCYFLSPLSSLAYAEPQRLMNMGVDLGDGTYAVRFVRNGVTSYVRVDGDLAAGGWSYGLANQMPGSNGNMWGSIFEKAYAFFRSAGNSYSSLNYGYQANTLNDLGVTTTSVSAASGSTTIMNLINSQVSAGHAMAVNTNGSISGGAPLIASHVYTILSAYMDGSTLMIRVRNPWGVDGAGSDGVNDGIVTLTYAQFSSNFGTLVYATV